MGGCLMNIEDENVNFRDNNSTNNNMVVYNFWPGRKVIPSPGTQDPRDPQDWEPRTLGHSKFTVTTILFQRLSQEIHFK